VLDALEQVRARPPPLRRGSFIIRIAEVNICPKNTNALPKLASNRQRQRRRTATTTHRRDTSNGLYKAEVIWRRGPWLRSKPLNTATTRMGGLVQQSSASGADRQHPARERKRTTMAAQEPKSYGGRNLNPDAPRFPARFRPLYAPHPVVDHLITNQVLYPV